MSDLPDDFLDTPAPSAADETPEPGTGSRRLGRARQRQQQRLQQRNKTGSAESAPADPSEPVAPSPGTPRAPRTPRAERQPRTAARLPQVQPTGRLSASTLSLGSLPLGSIRTAIYAAGAIILVIGVILLMGSLRGTNPAQSLPNAIWLGIEWTYEEPDDAAVQALVERLRQHGIGTIYAWVSYLDEGGAWGGASGARRDFEAVAARVQRFRVQMQSAFPEADLYGWISVQTDLGGDGNRLVDPAVQAAVADFSAGIITDMGFDGVFLDVRPVSGQNSAEYIALLNAVQLAIRDDALIAVAVPPDLSPVGAGIPVSPRIAPGTVWEDAFKQRVALLTDQMAVLAFDSGLTSPVDYSEWVAYQVETYARTMAEIDTTRGIIIGIPTYDDNAPLHLASVENVDSALNGIRRGLSLSGTTAEYITGTALYWEATTDSQEWNNFGTGASGE